MTAPMTKAEEIARVSFTHEFLRHLLDYALRDVPAGYFGDGVLYSEWCEALIQKAKDDFPAGLLSPVSREGVLEEAARIADGEWDKKAIVAPLTNAAYDEAARTIAAKIRALKSTSAPGSEVRGR
jgi:hypothetical protein